MTQSAPSAAPTAWHSCVLSLLSNNLTAAPSGSGSILSKTELPEQLKPVQAWDAYLHRVADLPLLAVGGLPNLAFPVQPAASPEAAAALHAPISLEEVLEGLQNLRNGRASGVRGLPAELLRYAKAEPDPDLPALVNVLAPMLVDVLNCAFAAGRVPASANGGLVKPVYKKGSKIDPLNYRPIAVTEPVMRLYAGILNSRLLNFTEGAGLRAEHPGRVKASALHRTSVLHLAFHDRQHKDKQPMYACFLDLKGAYDRVNRELLWEVLRRLGVDGRMLGALQSLYANVTVAMKIGDRTGQSLPSPHWPEAGLSA